MASNDPPPSLEILGINSPLLISCLHCYFLFPYLSFTSLLVRTPDEFSLWTGPPFPNAQPAVKLDKVTCLIAKFCDDGSKLMVMKPQSVITVYDCATSKEIRSFEVPNVAAAILSPCGTYLQTFQKPATPQEKNVTLWKTETGDPVYQHSQKNTTKTTWYVVVNCENKKVLSLTKFVSHSTLKLSYFRIFCFSGGHSDLRTCVDIGSYAYAFLSFRPSIQFSSDEAVACRMATNEVQFFDTGDFSKGVIYRLKVPGVAAIELSKTPGSHVAVLVPESKVCIPRFCRYNGGLLHIF